jgi:hypothetical protein
VAYAHPNSAAVGARGSGCGCGREREDEREHGSSVARHVQRARTAFRRLFPLHPLMRRIVIRDIGAAPSRAVRSFGYAAWTNSPNDIYVSRDIDPRILDLILLHEAVHIRQFSAAGRPRDYITMMRYECEAYRDSVADQPRTNSAVSEFIGLSIQAAVDICTEVLKVVTRTSDPARQERLFRDFLIDAEMLPPHRSLAELYGDTKPARELEAFHPGARGIGRPRPQRQRATTGQATGAGPPAQCSPDARACFSVSRGLAWLFGTDGRVILSTRALGGRRHHRTPVGRHRVEFKDIDHVSSTYHAPMPYYVNFADQVGFHQGSLHTPSHGCVHLSPSAAQTFYRHLRKGDLVIVTP